ncbi:hypothetical protein A4A49_01016 [Nicotiana attenuata]|uniref:Uncharacterized protein n=1 Tax=Nicotiana attenuata TaxID=49451 RepID=A0A314L5U7_NICAT|nr:hypothetical protein A4A49_01016 [Nicotiana attenuata]
MQARRNKYKQDNRGHIIENTKEKEADNGKGENKIEAVATENKFDVLEVEEIDQPTLRITYGKGDDNVKDKVKQQLDKGSQELREKEHLKKVDESTLNPKKTGNSIGESVKELEKSKDSIIIPKEQSIIQAGGNRGPTKEVRNRGGSYTAASTKKQSNETVNSRSVEVVLVNVGDVPVEVSRNNQARVVNVDILENTVGLELHTVGGKAGDSNGTIISWNPAIGNGSEVLKDSFMEHEHLEKAIVPKKSDAIATVPMACASGTGFPTPIQINLTLKSPNQVLHDIITYKVLPEDIYNALVDQQQLEDEGDDEFTVGNFKAVARKRDLSPRISARSGKKGKKQTQAKELLPPTRIFPKRAASTLRW